MPSAAVGLGAAGLLIGVLIGSTGIGGVLLVPFLVHGLGQAIQVPISVWPRSPTCALAGSPSLRDGPSSAR